MRVTNWQRWQRTKGITAFCAFLGAIACVGGLEGDATEPMPSPAGAIFLLAVCLLLTLNITKNK